MHTPSNSVSILPVDKEMAPPNIPFCDLEPSNGTLIFVDANTGLTLDETSNMSNIRAIKIALSYTNKKGQKDIRYNTGRHIVRNLVKSYSFRPHTAGRNQKLKISGYKVQCETEYILSLSLRNQIAQRFTSEFLENKISFSVTTGCCDPCSDSTDCFSGDMNEVTMNMVNQINMQANGQFVRATAYPSVAGYDTTGSGSTLPIDTPLTSEQLQAMIDYNANLADDSTSTPMTSYIVLEALPATPSFNNTEIGMSPLVRTNIQANLMSGFDCNGVIEEIQTSVEEEGSYEDIRDLEYENESYQGGNFVRYTEFGREIDSSSILSKSDSKYNLVCLTYQADNKEIIEDCTVMIAIPTDLGSVDGGKSLQILDKWLGDRFDSLHDEYSQSIANIETVEPTVTDSPNSDGIA